MLKLMYVLILHEGTDLPTYIIIIYILHTFLDHMWLALEKPTSYAQRQCLEMCNSIVLSSISQKGVKLQACILPQFYIIAI